MATCSVCGNDYDKAFTVQMWDGTSRTYDSVECAAHVLAPRCGHCECQILGHGVEVHGQVYCCRHCADAMVGSSPITDRA
ncbi:MAG: hypothetical protein GEV07_21635 [Streptosporangiales bacterium]|nr:hypothetical protein [Streptosporangiales bacterium]